MDREISLRWHNPRSTPQKKLWVFSNEFQKYPIQELPIDDSKCAVFAENHDHGIRASAFFVRKRRWKLIHYESAPHQLFDLEEDPHDLRNPFAELEAELHRI
jgi:choline-sulfatase